jgi:hypothetical protein
MPELEPDPIIGSRLNARGLYFNRVVAKTGNVNACRIGSLFAVAMLLAGCAGNKVADRKRERPAAYAALPPAQQRWVDEGRIDVGMSSDGVYIAWGKPAMIVPTTPGNVTWIYRCNDTTAVPAWEHRPAPSSRYGARYGTVERGTQFVGVAYDCAEVNFEGNVVKSWREIPRPEH